MKQYPYLFTAAIAFLAFGCALFGNGAKITALITGQNAFVSSKDLVPGTFRKITVPDLPEPMPPAGRGGPAARFGGGPGSSYAYYAPGYDRYEDAVAPAPVVDDPDAVSYCMQTYPTFDPASGTYLSYDGFRYPCP